MAPLRNVWWPRGDDSEFSSGAALEGEGSVWNRVKSCTRLPPAKGGARSASASGAVGSKAPPMPPGASKPGDGSGTTEVIAGVEGRDGARTCGLAGGD